MQVNANTADRGKRSSLTYPQFSSSDTYLVIFWISKHSDP